MTEQAVGRLQLRSEIVEEIRAELLDELRERGIDEGVLQEIASRESAGQERFYRMTVNQRVQHLILLVSFTTLVLTGFALKLPRETVAWLGPAGDAIFQLRGVLHRIAAAWMIGASFYHVYYILFTKVGRADLKAIWVRPRKDLQDAIDTIRFGLGLRAELPDMERFNYKEKAEYWALVWGTLVMSVTGVLLWSAAFWSALIVDVSRAVHSYEAILAALSILVWHMYGVHIRPGVFPMSRTWLDGWIQREEMKEEHGLEYRRRT